MTLATTLQVFANQMLLARRQAVHVTLDTTALRGQTPVSNALQVRSQQELELNKFLIALTAQLEKCANSVPVLRELVQQAITASSQPSLSTSTNVPSVKLSLPEADRVRQQTVARTVLQEATVEKVQMLQIIHFVEQQAMCVCLGKADQPVPLANTQPMELIASLVLLETTASVTVLRSLALPVIRNQQEVSRSVL